MSWLRPTYLDWGAAEIVSSDDEGGGEDDGASFGPLAGLSGVGGGGGESWCKRGALFKGGASSADVVQVIFL